MGQRKQLALRKAAVYQARNKVDSMFERVYRLHQSTRNIPECRTGAGKDLEVIPSSDQVIAVGASLPFTIVGGEGVPRVFLAGNNGTDEALVELSVTIVGGVVNAIVKAGKKPAPGPLYLVVLDGEGKRREEIVITPQAAPTASDK